MSVVNEERLMVSGPVGQLEVASVTGGSGELAESDFFAVVCHPHPLYGGTMDNKVVTTLVRAYRELGIPVARFNFRGAGKSEGAHDNGVGEVEDLFAVVNWMKEKTGKDKLLLAGFSFGTGVVSNFSSREPALSHLVLVAPPVGRYNFQPVSGYACPVCVVMGDQDELVDAQQVYQWADSLTPAPAVIRIAEATHFFHGQLVNMRRQLVSVLRDQLAGS